jgi:hypothetical protein
MSSSDMVVYFVCVNKRQRISKIQNGQSRETGTQDGDKQKHGAIYVL